MQALHHRVDQAADQEEDPCQSQRRTLGGADVHLNCAGRVRRCGGPGSAVRAVDGVLEVEAVSPSKPQSQGQSQAHPQPAHAGLQGETVILVVFWLVAEFCCAVN